MMVALVVMYRTYSLELLLTARLADGSLRVSLQVSSAVRRPAAEPAHWNRNVQSE